MSTSAHRRNRRLNDPAVQDRALAHRAAARRCSPDELLAAAAELGIDLSQSDLDQGQQDGERRANTQ
jgi:hypothetical protein